MEGNGSRGSWDSWGRHRDERHGHLVPVRCARCGACVLVAKFSPQHTSVQWSAEAVRTCLEFAYLGRPSALVEGCAALRDSIDAAVEVSPP